MHVTVAHSEDIDSSDAIAEVLASCGDEWAAPPRAGLLFAGVDHDFGTLTSAVLDRWPELELVGCSTDGEISSTVGKSQDSVVLALFGSERVGMRVGVGRNIFADPAAAARDAIEAAKEGLDKDIRLCIVVMEGLRVDACAVVETIQAALPSGAVVVGGLAGGGGGWDRTVQTIGREVLEGTVCVLLFAGPLTVSAAAGNGWVPVGSMHRVTKSAGTRLSEIDDHAAVDLYTRYLGGHSLYHPLAVYPKDDGEFFIATSPSVDPDGSVTVLNNVPTGSGVRLADAHADDLIVAAELVSREAAHAFRGLPVDAGLAFSCSGRRILLGSRVGEEIDLLRQSTGLGIPIAGFYSYGEICPLRGQHEARVHNSTLAFVLLGEEELT